MKLNTYGQVQSLQKSPITVGGLCAISFFKWEDVLVWPKVDPATGRINTSIQMKPGKSIFICQAADSGRSLNEKSNMGDAGPFVDVEVTGTLGGTNTANIITLISGSFHEWGLIVKDRSGHHRLVGGPDAGATLSWEYTSSDPNGSRTVKLKWKWQHPMGAPVYQSQTFNITIGGVVVTAGSLTLVIRFQVGTPNSPMDHGDTVLQNNLLANHNVLALADGIALPCDDGSGQINWTGLITRHIIKTYASNQITYVGGVNSEEIHEIYAFD